MITGFRSPKFYSPSLWTAKKHPKYSRYAICRTDIAFTKVCISRPMMTIAEYPCPGYAALCHDVSSPCFETALHNGCGKLSHLRVLSSSELINDQSRKPVSIPNSQFKVCDLNISKQNPKDQTPDPKFPKKKRQKSIAQIRCTLQHKKPTKHLTFASALSLLPRVLGHCPCLPRNT